MTHDSENSLFVEPDAGASSDLIPAMARLMRILRLRKNTVFTSLFGFGLIGAAYFLLATPLYESSAKLLIIQQNQDHFSTMGDHDGSDNTMATQRELVCSPIVLQQAIHLLPPEHRIDLQNKPPREWVETLAKRLSAGITRKTNFIDVSYRSQHPETAAAVVRAVIQSYLQFVEKTHKGTAGDVINVLTHERNRLQESLNTKQHELQQFRQKVGHLAVSSDDGIVEPVIQRALRLNEALLTTQEKHLELQATLTSVEGALQRGEDINQYLMSIEATLGREVLLASMGMSRQDLQVLGDQQKKLLSAQEELQSLSSFYGPNHPRIVELRQQIGSLKQFLTNYRSDAGQRYDSLQNAIPATALLGMLRQSVRQTAEKEQQLQTAFEQARSEAAKHSGDLVRLKMLEREVARLESLLDLLFDKIAAVDIRQVQAPIQATVVREPLPAIRPASPKLQYVILMSVFGGLAVGSLIAYVQDVLDDHFTSPEELSSQLGVPMLAMVRELDPLEGEGLAGVHANRMPNATETEAFRTLRTALTLGANASERILISSSEPGDGKTTVAANLAVAFAKAGKKTLIVDADLRRPGMTAMMALKGKPGVSDVLVAEKAAAEIAAAFVHHTEVEHLDILPAGLRRPNPAELLSGQNFAELLAWADSQYDQVLVDCPPVLAVSDAQIVGRFVDGAILVVRPDKNHRRMVLRAVESFQATDCPMLGVVANGISADSAGYGYGYGYGYSYGYGHDEQDSMEQIDEAPSASSNLTTGLSAVDDPRDSPMPQGSSLSDSTIRPRRAA